MRTLALAARAVACAALGLLLTGCADGSVSRPAATEPGFGGSWQLVELLRDGVPVALPESGRATLVVDEGHLSGTAFCNGFGSDYRLDDGRLELLGLAATEMACAPEWMTAQEDYLDALAQAQGVDVRDEDLRLTGADVVLRFELLPPVPTQDLVGTAWVLESLVDGETVTSTAGGPAWLRLGDDGTVAGSTGCREFTATWTAGEDTVRFPEQQFEIADCLPELARQDAHVRAVLGGDVRVAVEGDVLTIGTDFGSGLVYRAG